MPDSAGNIQTEPPRGTDERSLVLPKYPPDYPFAPQYPPGGPPPSAPPAGIESASAAFAVEVKPGFSWGAWALIACGCAGFNFVLAPLVEAFDAPPLMVAIAYTVLASQLAAQSIWMVWSERPLWQRLLVGTIAGWLLLACFLTGIRLNIRGASDFAEAARAMLCSLPLVMLSVQAPLWALRIYARWRIVHIASATPGGSRPLAIGDICAATTVVALALTLMRLASRDPQFYEVAWIGWTIAVPIIAAVSLLSLAPGIYLVLYRSRPLAGLLLWWGYASVMSILALLVIAAASGEQIGVEEGSILLCTVGGAGAMVWMLLCAARARGYRLVMCG